MKILYLANHLNIGGISSYIFTLSKGMKKKGHVCFVASGPGELTPKLCREGVNYIPVPTDTKAEISLNVAVSFFKLRRKLREHNIDIMHASTRVTQVLACLLKRSTGIPYISTCHGFFKNRITRRIFPCWGDKVIAISEQVREHLMQDFSLPPGNIRMIHNGIDLDKFVMPPKEHINIQKNKLGLGSGPVIGIMARLSDVKGHVYLIKAMETVLAQFPATQLLIVGEGKIKGRLAGLSQKLGISKQVAFVPNILDTVDALCVMDIFVLPSLKEGLGLSLMEAMALGRAVIGSNIGGIKTLIADNISGLLVEPKTVSPLADAIIKLLRDPVKRQVYGSNAKVFIRENFSEEKMVLETERLYSECVKQD